MKFRKPGEKDEGQTFDKGGTGSGSGSGSGGGSGSITEERVQFGDEKVTVADALRLTGDILMGADGYDGFATSDEVEKLRKENEQLRADLEQHREAIADLAEAVEAIASNQADMAGMSESATVLLGSDAYGDIYQPTTGEK